MISTLHIKNIGIIEDLTVDLNTGFNVLTGETGAGKTLIIDSLNLACGGRFSKEIVRRGENFCLVELNIYLPQNENSIDGNIIISREIFLNGRNTCKINGRLVTVNELKEFMSKIIDIHGQNDNQTIMSKQEHINYLDNFIGKDFDFGDATKEKVAAKFDRIKKLFPEDSTATIVFSKGKLDYRTEVTIPLGKRVLRAESSEKDFMASIDKTVDILERQIVNYKKRLRTITRNLPKFADEYANLPVDEALLDDEKDSEIVKVKTFELRPMSPEEAVMQLELIDHSFFVFLNDKSECVNVVYKRKDGEYGLLTPEA